MARQRGKVQLEQSDMRLALNMVYLDKGGFSCTAMEETHHVIKNSRDEIRKDKKWGAEFRGYKIVKAAMVRQLAVL